MRPEVLPAVILAALMLVPPVHGDVLTLETDKPAYYRGDEMIFSGVEEDGKKMVTLIIRDPSGTKVDLKGDPSSDSDGSFKITPISVRDVFSTPGIYKIQVFTDTQSVADSTNMHMEYDGRTAKVVKVYDLELRHIGNKVIDENKKFSFVAGITDPSIADEEYSLGSNAPAGAFIGPKSGKFTWTPAESQGPGVYMIEVIARAGVSEASETITITVRETAEPATENPVSSPISNPISNPIEDPASSPAAPPEPDEMAEEPPLGIAPFVDPQRDPQYYVDRYNGEKVYRDWFDDSFPQYSSIYQAAGMEEPKTGICGEGTALIDGVCTVTEGYGQARSQTCFLFWCW